MRYNSCTKKGSIVQTVTVGEMALRVAVGVVQDGFVPHVQQLAGLDAGGVGGQLLLHLLLLLGERSDGQQRGLGLAAHSHAHRGELHAICSGHTHTHTHTHTHQALDQMSS